MPPRVILIGPPGAGKSTVARILARRWDLPVIDTDELVVENAGKSVSDIFVEDGEARFRELEVHAVRAAVSSTSGVVALGGGAVMSAANDELLSAQSAPIVFLDVSIASAAPRVGFNRDRPLLVTNPRAAWIALMDKRRDVYQRLARHVVSTDDRVPEEIADEIEALV